ncbi:MAG: hypothetical protein QOI66_2086 [Myxococcales bacterium]|nr:hypothetical protein [Myxococcales bacterium]
MVSGTTRADQPGTNAPTSASSTVLTPWQFEPRLILAAAVPLGDTRQFFSGAWAVGAGLAIGRREAPTRWRTALLVEPALGVGDNGASMTFLRFGLGAEHLWWGHLLAGLDTSVTWQRITIPDEIISNRFGLSESLEIGWRSAAIGRWSFTAGGRYTVTAFLSDGFFWHELAVAVTVTRSPAK